MKKSLRSLAVLSVAALGLTSCVSKCTFAEFKEAAQNREKESYTKVSFSGKYKTEGTTFDMSGYSATFASNNWKVTANSDDSAFDQAAKIIVGGALIAITVDVYTVAENTNYTYYKGSGFKIENSGDTKSYWEFNSSGYFTAISDGTNTIKASWSK